MQWRGLQPLSAAQAGLGGGDVAGGALVCGYGNISTPSRVLVGAYALVQPLSNRLGQRDLQGVDVGKFGQDGSSPLRLGILKGAGPGLLRFEVRKGRIWNPVLSPDSTRSSLQW